MTKTKKLWVVKVRERRYEREASYNVVAPNFIEAGRKGVSRSKREDFLRQPYVTNVQLVGDVS